MTTKAISVTEAARNFADCVNRAHYQGTTFVLHKNGVPVARIVPEEHKKACTGPELADALRRIPNELRLTKEDATDWLEDIEEARKSLVPQRDKWE